MDGSPQRWITPGGAEITFEYNVAGQPTRQTDPTGIVTTVSYDATGRVTATANPSTGATQRTEYDAAGQPTAHLDAMGARTEFSYRMDGRLGSILDPRGNTWSMAYSPNTVTTIDPLGRQKTVRMDSEGRVVEQCCGSGSPLTIQYFEAVDEDGEDYPLSIVDAGGHVRTFAYGPLGLLIGATDLGGNAWQFAYDTRDRLASVTSPTGETVHTFGHDALDNVTSLTHADGGTYSFAYNPKNQLAAETRPSGVTVTNLYDAEGRLASKSASNGETFSFTYRPDGRPLTVQTAEVTTAYTYGADGSIEELSRSDGSRVVYVRDLNQRVTAISARAAPAAPWFTTQYLYDPNGNVISVTDPSGAVTSLEYDAVNRVTQRTQPSGVRTTYGYDADDRIVSLVHRNPAGTVLSSFTYERTGNGEPSRITGEDGSVTLLAYDAAHRLQSEEFRRPDGTLEERIEYTYDANGNRTRKTSSTGTTEPYIYAPGFRLTTAGAASFTYDAEGRTATRAAPGGSNSFTFGVQDLITSWTDSATGARIRYGYDAAGDRIEVERGAQRQRWVSAALPQSPLPAPLLVADAESGASVGAFAYVGSVPIMRLNPDGTSVYYLEDAGGSVVGLVDQTGASLGAIRYDAFGNVRTSSVNAATTREFQTLGGDYRFQGAWADSSTGLYHFRAREYDPRIGRFLSRDPEPFSEQLPESAQWYSFANQNPHYYGDPSGRITLSDISVSVSLTGKNAALRGISARAAWSLARKRLAAGLKDALRNQIENALLEFFEGFVGVSIPNPASGGGSPFDIGNLFEQLLRDALCALHKNRGAHMFYWEVPVSRLGVPRGNGYQCNPNGGTTTGTRRGGSRGDAYPDLILSMQPPYNGTEFPPKGITIAEFKSSGRAFVRKFSAGNSQYQAIKNYAKTNTYTRTAVLVGLKKGSKSDEAAFARMVEARFTREGVLVIAIFAK